MSRRFRFLWLALLLGVLAAAAHAQPPRRAMLVTIDGLRPDLALRADMPALRGLMARGAYTFWAHTSPLSITLPSHATMLTGVPPAKHGITWNDDSRPDEVRRVAWPTVFVLAHEAGLRTAIGVGKRKLDALAPPGTADLRAVPPVADTLLDRAVADTVVRWLVTGRPQFVFVHLPGPDLAGHSRGWGSPSQIAAIERADRALSRILRALDQTGLAESTLVIVTADHGGIGTHHDQDDVRTHTVPWIAAGPGVRRGVDLGSDAATEVHLQDTFAVLCDQLGLVPPRPVDGRVPPGLRTPGR